MASEKPYEGDKSYHKDAHGQREMLHNTRDHGRAATEHGYGHETRGHARELDVVVEQSTDFQYAFSHVHIFDDHARRKKYSCNSIVDQPHDLYNAFLYGALREFDPEMEEEEKHYHAHDTGAARYQRVTIHMLQYRACAAA